MYVPSAREDGGLCAVITFSEIPSTLRRARGLGQTRCRFATILTCTRGANVG